MNEKNFLQELSTDLRELFSNGNNYDVIIQTEENENPKELYAHSLILCSRSTYFKAALSKNWAYKENGMIIFKKPNISPEIMKLLLKYLYCGTVELDKQRGINVLKLFIAADELDFRSLSDYILNYIIENRENYIRDDPINILEIIFKNELFNSLREFCLEFICENSNILFESSDFLSLDKSILLLLIQRDDFNIKEEYEIWNYILKWGIEKTLSIKSNDISNWSTENFFELKEILYEFMLHIRWFQIPPKTFYQKISQFEQIFPNYLYKDIVHYYFNPSSLPFSKKYYNLLKSRKSKFFNSKIITKNFLPIFSNWINYKEKCYNHNDDDDNDNELPYCFELIYRASRDGFSSTNFHKLCDNKGSTIIICKLKENGKLIGGYNPNNWNYNDNEFFANSEDSFLFHFNNSNILEEEEEEKEETKEQSYYEEPIIARLVNKDYDYHCNLNYGPTFGTGFDLIIENNIIKCNNIVSYPKLLAFIKPGQTYFLEDYEVFKVTKFNELTNNKIISMLKKHVTFINKFIILLSIIFFMFYFLWFFFN